MSRFILPTRVGTELLVRQTAVPARVIVVGVNRSDQARQLVENQYMAQITNFYQKHTQLRSLSTIRTYVGRETIGDLKLTLISLYDVDTITVEVPLGAPKPEPWPVVLRIRSVGPIEVEQGLAEFSREGDIGEVDVSELAVGISNPRVAPVNTSEDRLYKGFLYNYPQPFGIPYPGATRVIADAAPRYGGFLIDMRRMRDLGVAGENPYNVTFSVSTNYDLTLVHDVPFSYTMSYLPTLFYSAYNIYSHTGAIIGTGGGYSIWTGDSLFPSIGDPFPNTKWYRITAVPVDPSADPVDLGWGQFDQLQNSRFDYDGSNISLTSGFRQQIFLTSYIDPPYWANETNNYAEQLADLNRGINPSGVLLSVPLKYYDFGPQPFFVPINDPDSDGTYAHVSAHTTSFVRGLLRVRENDNRARVFERRPLELVVELLEYRGLDLGAYWSRMEEIIARYRLGAVDFFEGSQQIDTVYEEMVAAINAFAPITLSKTVFEQRFQRIYNTTGGGLTPRAELVVEIPRAAEFDWTVTVIVPEAIAGASVRV